MQLDVMQSYVDLVESGQGLDAEPSVPSVRQSVVDLVRVAHRDGPLELEGAWRLDAGAARELEERTGYSPPGGWRRLAALAAGTGALRAKREAFEPDVAVEELTDRPERSVEREMIEAFTCRLVPPTTAAGLFILLRLHPAWGVHLAHRAHGGERAPDLDPPGSSGSERGRLFPERSRRVAEGTVFGAIACIVATLRELDANRVYAVDGLADFVDAVCRSIRAGAEDGKAEGSGGLEVFVGDVDADVGTSTWRVLDFATDDLIDSLLVPAGAGRRFEDGTFCVFEGAFDEVEVGEFGPDEQLERLVRELSDGDECRVA
ncbi:MAG: hypothetical protein ABEL76_11150 [Bradymonadaceae bacterium]